MSASKNLVIVESPTKARTITRILGQDYTVTASMGHVRDLPENSLGVNISGGFEPNYQVSKRSVVSSLKNFCKGAKVVYLAPDPDREGEAIAWHIREILKDSVKCDFRRVVFHEITKSAVSEAFRHPGDINMNLVNSQQARRILDRIVGFKISEMLWSKISKGLSAGRVQSVALRIICEREREILAFVPREYWILTAKFAQGGAPLEYVGKLSAVDGAKAENISADDAARMADAIEKSKSCRIGEISTKRKLKHAPPPFITSTLQQAAVQYLRMSASHAMRVAQQLYEGIEIGGEGQTGLITYMRTDSFSVSKEALAACRSFIGDKFGADFLPEKPNFFKSGKGAQEAHEAIRPTDVFRTPDAMRQFLSPDQLRLYTFIWKRFVASQSRPAEYDVTTVSTLVGGADGRSYDFRTVGTVLVFQGYLKAYEAKSADEDDAEPADAADSKALLLLKEGADAVLRKLDKEQKFTEPPARFSEATLIKELESNGIGRPSTYATILGTILGRKYVERAKGRLVPTELGFKVNDTLVRTVSDLFQVGFTAEMEAELDKVEEGDLDWKKMLSEFYAQFSVWLKSAKMEGAPSDDKVRPLMEALAAVGKWNPAEKAGRRKYDDRKFFDSVKEQFEANGAISERQWNALVSMAAKYKDQIVDFDSLASSLGISEMLSRSELEMKERMSPENVERSAKLAALVEELAKIAKEEGKNGAEAGGGKGRYDDSSFLNSFSKRLSRGIPLSDKQAAVLGRIASKHKDKLASFAEIQTLIAIPGRGDGQAAVERKMTGEKENARISELLARLKKVQDWREGKGRRSDKTFFLSLSRQFSQRGALSEKQFSALEKMAAKYPGNASGGEGGGASV